MANHMKGLRSISCHTRMKPAHKQMTRGLRYETQHYLLSNIKSYHFMTQIQNWHHQSTR